MFVLALNTLNDSFFIQNIRVEPGYVCEIQLGPELYTSLLSDPTFFQVDRVW